MTTELDVLGLVSDRLSAHGLPFMLTGSFALAYYATPRMTRDLDIVVALKNRDVDGLVAAFAPDFYIDAGAAHQAILSERLFNLMHLESGVKVDLIVRKSSEYRQVKFARRQAVSISGKRTWIVRCEDLILSKAVWVLESDSELQRRDIRQLLAAPIDLDYIREWAPQMGRLNADWRTDAMNDTPEIIARMVTDRYRSMSPTERCLAASSMYETARRIVESSLPTGLTLEQRRLAIVHRLYQNELPQAALAAHARYRQPEGVSTSA